MMSKYNQSDQENELNKNGESEENKESQNKKFQKKFQKKFPKFRTWFQACFFALTNGYAYGFTEGKIFTGKSKRICVPGLNCYSCPGALGACPIGSLQAVLGDSGFRISCYVLGFLLFFGSVFGRFVCGWLCPFGWVQDLLYRIPIFHKRKNFKGHKYLSKLKYVILLFFVILLPMFAVNTTGNGSPWFCEWICPSGTLFGGIPLVLGNEKLRSAIGFRFAWKVVLLILILLLSVKWYRPFCKYLCPLGGIYGAFNGFSLMRLEVDEKKCIQCGGCQAVCRMDIKTFQTPNHPDCIRCMECVHACPQEAIHLHKALPFGSEKGEK